MTDTLTAKKSEYEAKLQQLAQQEQQLLQQLATVRAQGQTLQGAIAALTDLQNTPPPNRAARRRK